MKKKHRRFTAAQESKPLKKKRRRLTARTARELLEALDEPDAGCEIVFVNDLPRPQRGPELSDAAQLYGLILSHRWQQTRAEISAGNRQEFRRHERTIQDRLDALLAGGATLTPAEKRAVETVHAAGLARRAAHQATTPSTNADTSGSGLHLQPRVKSGKPGQAAAPGSRTPAHVGETIPSSQSALFPVRRPTSARGPRGPLAPRGRR